MDKSDLGRLTLEPAHASDGATLARLNAELHAMNGERLTEEQALRDLRMLRVAGYALGVCRAGGTAIGYALWREKKRETYIRHFVIDAPYRRQGVGRRFAGLVLATLPGDRDVRLDVRTEAAIRFWSSLGFRAEPWGMRLERRRKRAR
ncbi:MAG: GNAT family N-acetyltransferase [Paracoccaceae bacterium]